MVSRRYSRGEAGFSLIEVLISLLILSIGMLGLGGLQLSALKSANNAHYRTVAGLAVTDLVDRMRANPSAVQNNLYTALLGSTHCKTALEKVCEAANECSSAEMATYDLYRVNCGVKGVSHQTGGVQFDLPEAALVIGCAIPPCTSGDEYLIQVSWNETDDDDEDDDVQSRSYIWSFIP